MQHRIAFLSKYPPIEGGIAARTYWLARGLAARGHEVHVITHGTGTAGQYQIEKAENPPDARPNLKIHRCENVIPWHIPEDKETFISLLDLTLDLVKRNTIEVLDSGYLVPYGIVGSLARKLTGVRHVMRHGGSDLEKFLKNGIFPTLLADSIASSDMIVTNKADETNFKSMTSNVISIPAYIPDEAVFHPNRDRHLKHGRLAFIGKINYHWEHKALDKISSIMGYLVPEYECLIVGQGNGLSNFKQSLTASLSAAIQWRPFIAPWDMPELLENLDAIFLFESMLPYRTFSNLALEAIWSGVGIITDRLEFADIYTDTVALTDDQVIAVSPDEPMEAAAKVKAWLNMRKKAVPRSTITFNDYLTINEKIYTRLLDMR
ncbi:MAG: glycosyltransferase [Dehalococcoidia bacterium]|nr:glycosyltransferase [Dehalococcoidia bacterium]MDD5493191.1 glycosyltransferase [Dehalococcoidia bacterium]